MYRIAKLTSVHYHRMWDRLFKMMVKDLKLDVTYSRDFANFNFSQILDRMNDGNIAASSFAGVVTPERLQLVNFRLVNSWVKDNLSHFLFK